MTQTAASAVKHAHIHTHTRGLRSHISAAFYLAHYQNGNLSVAHTPESFQPITPFPKRRGGTASSNRFLEQDQRLMKRARHRQHEGSKGFFLWVGCVTWRLSESRQRWVKEEGTQTESLKNFSELQPLITSFWLGMKRSSRNTVSCVVMQQSADHPFKMQTCCGSLNLIKGWHQIWVLQLLLCPSLHLGLVTRVLHVF